MHVTREQKKFEQLKFRRVFDALAPFRKPRTNVDRLAFSWARDGRQRLSGEAAARTHGVIFLHSTGYIFEMGKPVCEVARDHVGGLRRKDLIFGGYAKRDRLHLM